MIDIDYKNKMYIHDYRRLITSKDHLIAFNLSFCKQLIVLEKTRTPQHLKSLAKGHNALPWLGLGLSETTSSSYQ